MYEQYGLFISGRWTSSSRTADVISPVTEQPLGQVPLASREDTLAALDAAHNALPALRAMGGYARAEALHKVADEMVRRSDEAARMICAETGKPIAQAGREWVLACEQFRWCAEEARRIYGRIIDSRVPGGRFEVTREAVGVVGAFSAWNFPAALPARKLAPALAAGCAVVLRPSSQTPGVAMIMVDCLRVWSSCR
ncbi:aldehyde dehydrogenase family protein [Pseudomonas sp.]|uniref:aldehyde dehydrogenase family protein n=1 Tax=Pseudomonas sp. TaxID=306 RepID=UPI00258E48E5|nr:aldehyde dehydrogenase family protein [Pseudomonas sp.]